MILTIVGNYKSKEQPYANGFVHRRVLSYKKSYDSEVFLLDKDKKDYTFENVNVNCGDHTRCIEFINTKKVKAICVHFLDTKMIKIIKSIDYSIPVFIFVHGVEALYWHQRIFPGAFSDFKSILKFSKYSLINTKRMFEIQRFLSTRKDNIHLIAVSNWMAEQANANWKVRDKEWSIIPNVIDTELFNYTEREEKLKYKFLSIRPFSTGKYANDITVKLIIELSKYKEFEQFEFLIVGKGQLFNKVTAPLKKYSNVKLENKFLQQDEISNLHKKFGFFLCPTRQDAQGVSMCEAMSSGLIPLSTNCTAIPEFLPNEFGLALNDVTEMASKIIEIIRTPGLYKDLSYRLSEYIGNKCSEEKTTLKELELIHQYCK